MKNRAAEVIVLVLAVLIGITLGVLITNWPATSPIFLEMRLIQIIQLLITVLLAIFIAYFVQTLVSKSLRKREMISELISRFQSKISDVFNLGDSYIREPDREKQQRIISSLKAASMMLGVIEDIRKDKVGRGLIQYDGLKKDFLEFKEALTDSPFGEKDPIYGENAYRKFELKYTTLSHLLHKTIFMLYA